MQDTRAFYPLYSPSTGKTAGSLLPSITVAASTSAATSALIQGGNSQIQISNTTAAWAYVNFGNLNTGPSSVTAATVAASYPVAPGTVVVVSVDREVNAASVILSTGTGNVIFTRGEGL